jgi:hypothetical protein
MEYVKVTYPTKRSVNVDDEPTGDTDEILRMDAGTHSFDLGPPIDYDPASHEIDVTGTTILRPMVVVFTPKGD